MLEGVDMIANAVQTTLGPKGRNVVIEQSYGPPKITKDGVTVAKNIEFTDRYHNLGAQLVRSVASKTNDIAGDGTTTATVLARAIFNEGVKAVAAGMNPMDLRRGINIAVKQIVEHLENNSKKVTTKEEIAQVATISANGDKEIGTIIANAMDKIGKDGVITVQDGKTLLDELEVVEGMKFDRGYISPYFITDPKTATVQLEKPFILIFDKKISSIQSILPVLEQVLRLNRPLLIISEDVEGEALATLIMNKLRGVAKVAAVKAPGFGDNRKGMLQDIAIVTGGELVSEDVGMKLEDCTVEMLGQAEKVTISKDDTIIIDGLGSKDHITQRCETLREQINNESISSYEKEKLQERLGKLSSGIAVLKIGGASEVEVGEKKDRVTDALNATRAAVEEGIVPGGGTALLYSTLALDMNAAENFDQQHGMKIVKNAIKIPTKSIADNAGMEGAVVVGKLLEREGASPSSTFGLNAATGHYVDMIENGIIDPVKVVRTALADAASVASLMTTTEAMVVEAPKEPGAAAAPAPGMGGMGGMGGMY
jgi:chaperonin GroEL